MLELVGVEAGYSHSSVLHGVSLRIERGESVQAGLVHVSEGRRLFADMTVRENLILGGYTRRRGELHARMERVYEWFSRLRERANQRVGSLSGGEQQMVAIGCGLMANPTLLMLDEPSLASHRSWWRRSARSPSSSSSRMPVSP